MATDYKKRLQNLRDRRLGTDSPVASARGDYRFVEALYKTESYEARGKTDALKYGLGAMQQVDPEYTRIGIEEGERVKNQLLPGLSDANIPVSFEYQGSVPLNIHIRGTSDVDLLVLHNGFVTLDWSGPRANTYSKLNGSVVMDLYMLRRTCESVLDQRFPAATADKTGAKSIALSGGSLRRKIDIVPAHWHDTAAYQSSGQKHDRDVRILDKTVPETIANRPFFYMRKIEEKDIAANGGAKKVIRFLKNLRKDSDQDIALTSYDIASLVWHFDTELLSQPSYLEVTLIAVTQASLHYFVNNRNYTESLDVPDGSRKIIDEPNKFQSLVRLSGEVDQLVLDIARELNPFGVLTPDYAKRVLLEARV